MPLTPPNLLDLYLFPVNSNDKAYYTFCLQMRILIYLLNMLKNVYYAFFVRLSLKSIYFYLLNQ